jgi:hypothetical protein
VFIEFLFETLQTFRVLVDGADIFLKDNLLGRGRTDHFREPPEMGRVPGGLACITYVVPQQKSFQPKFRRLQVLDGIFPRAAQVADGFIFYFGHRDGSEVPRAHEPGQLHGITAVGFPAISGLGGNQRGRHDPTVVAFFVERAIEPGATGAGFIDEDEAFRLRLELTSELIAIRVSWADGPEGDDVGVVIFGNLGSGDGVFVDIQTDIECARLWHG